MKNFSPVRSQGGFTLIELLLVLAIIAAIAVAAFIGYPRVQAGRNATYEAQVLSSAVAGAKAIFANGNYVNLDNQVAVNAELFPKSMVDDAATGSILNQWEGDVTIDGTDAAGAAPAGTTARYMTIVYPNVPKDVCLRLGGAASQNFGRVAIGADAASATDVVNTFDTDGTNDVVDEAALSTTCVDGGNTMVFTSN